MAMNVDLVDLANFTDAVLRKEANKTVKKFRGTCKGEEMLYVMTASVFSCETFLVYAESLKKAVTRQIEIWRYDLNDRGVLSSAASAHGVPADSSSAEARQRYPLEDSLDNEAVPTSSYWPCRSTLPSDGESPPGFKSPRFSLEPMLSDPAISGSNYADGLYGSSASLEVPQKNQRYARAESCSSSLALFPEEGSPKGLSFQQTPRDGSIRGYLSEDSLEGGAAPAELAIVRCGEEADFACDRGTTAVHVAAYRGDLGSVRALIKAGCASAKTRNAAGWTPLLFAASSCSCAVMRDLLECGADVNARSCNGTTPLRQACFGPREGLEAAVELLLQWGADKMALLSAAVDKIENSEVGDG